MGTREILLAVQYLCIVVLFIVAFIVFRSWKTKLHSCLLLATLACLLNNIGYLFELKSTSMDEYITATQTSYAGRVWYAYFMFLFIAELVHTEIPKIIRTFFSLFNICVYITIMSLRSNTLYYKDMTFEMGENFPRLHHGNGIVHDAFMVVQLIYILFVFYQLFKALRKEKNSTARKCYITVTAAMLLESSLFVVQILHLHPCSDEYDLTMMGYFLGTVLILIAILSFDLLRTQELAKDFVIDRISEGIIAIDKENRVQYFNEPAKGLFPTLGEDDGPVTEEIRYVMSMGGNVKKNGRVYSIEENDLIQKGTHYGTLYAFTDETEHIRYMNDLREQRERADRANLAKSRFLANMSHEIRTPINAVIGMDEIILRESTEKSIRSYATSIMSAGKTLLFLINDILDLSKVEEGKMEILPVQYETATLIKSMVGMIYERAEKKGLKLNLQADEKLPRLLFGDEIRIRQCVLNLLTNAVKYTEKGSVTLDMGFERKDDGHIFLRVSVKDTGIGMKPEDMERLLVPFQRLDEERNRTIEGSGLGMSIVSGLLELMHSKLHAESEYGKGTTMSFAIEQEVMDWEPMGQLGEDFYKSEAENYEYHELFRAPEAKILVIDDTEMNITVMQNLLKKTKIQIDSALSGKEGVALAEKNKYDVLFIDHMMPGMDGVEALVNIRMSGCNKDTPSVALTANAISGAREMYLEAGFEDYLSKPVEGKKLEKLLQSMLPPEKIQQATDEEVVEGEEELPACLCDMKEIDTKLGITNVGSIEGYLSVVKVFYQSLYTKADEIERLYREKDWKNYTIKVHALKSSARIIGANELSSLAEALENAGNGNNLAFIDENTPELLEKYRALGEKFSLLESSSADCLPKLEKNALIDAFESVLEIAETEDYDFMDGLISDLRRFGFSKEDASVIDEVEDLMISQDWEGIKRLAAEALKNVKER